MTDRIKGHSDIEEDNIILAGGMGGEKTYTRQGLRLLNMRLSAV